MSRLLNQLFIPVIAGKKAALSLEQRIAAWEDAQTDLIFVGGNSAEFVGGTALGTVTMYSGYVKEQIRQSGKIKRIIAKWQATGAGTIQWKVFRRTDASHATFVANAEAYASVDASPKTYDLTSPMPCYHGDAIGLYCGGVVRIDSQSQTGNLTTYMAGDVSGNFTQAGASAKSMTFAGYSTPPYLCVTGDSIAEGYPDVASCLNGIVPGPATAIGGNIKIQIAQQLMELIGDGTLLTYQNLAYQSQNFSWVLSTGIPACLATNCHTIIIHCGINDVIGYRTWEQISADLDAIKTAVGTSARLLIDEILPNTAATDIVAAAVRTTNTNIAAWCAANGITMIPCHDAMGQIRASTGEIDDLVPAYTSDNVHLTEAGAGVMAAIWKTYL